MCGRMAWEWGNRLPEAELHIDQTNMEFSPNYNASPSQNVPVVIWGSRVLDMYRWGLIPHWAKEESIGNKLINARAETLLDKPSYRNAFLKRRCLILCSGFFEWKNKKPFYIKAKGKKVIALAGLYEEWTKGKEPIKTCTVITCGPNQFMKEIHHRMPVILDEAQFDEWLNPKTDADLLEGYLRPYEAELTAKAVSTEINSPKNNKKELLD